MTDVFEYVRRIRTLVLAAADVRAARAGAADFQTSAAAAQRYFASMATSWAVSIGHDYYNVRRALSLRPARQP